MRRFKKHHGLLVTPEDVGRANAILSHYGYSELAQRIMESPAGLFYKEVFDEQPNTIEIVYSKCSIAIIEDRPSKEEDVKCQTKDLTNSEKKQSELFKPGRPQLVPPHQE